MARPRVPGRKDWAPGLNARQRGSDIYYTWTNLLTNVEKSLKIKNDFHAANALAKQCNALIAQQIQDQHIMAITQATQTSGMIVKDWIAQYLDILFKREGKTNVYRSAKSLCKKIITHSGNMLMKDFGTQQAAEIIKIEADKGHKRSAQAVRTRGIDVFAEAKAAGHYPTQHPNPFAETKNVKARVKRGRLELDQFLEIIQHFKDDWELDACHFALISGFGPYDMSVTQFKKGNDWNKLWDKFLADEEGKAPIPYSYIEGDILYATRIKTNAMGEIPLDLRVDALNMSLGDIVNRCRMKGVVGSKYLIHHRRPVYKVKPGDRVHENTISKAFRRMRDKTDLSWAPKNPATIYECRSLAERLYAAQGINTSELLLHKDPETTKIYKDKRTPEFKKLALFSEK